MNVAGQFAQYRPVIEGDSGTGTLPLLLFGISSADNGV